MASTVCVDLASLLFCEPSAEHVPAPAPSFSFQVYVETPQQCWAEARQGPSARTGLAHRSSQSVFRGWLRPGVRRLLTALQPHYRTALLVRACCCCYSGSCSSAAGGGASGISSSSSSSSAARFSRRMSGGLGGSSDCGSSDCTSGDRSLRSSSSSTGRSSNGSAALSASSPGGALRGCGCGGFGYGSGADPTQFAVALLDAALPVLDADGTIFADRVFVVIATRDTHTPAQQLLSGTSPLASSALIPSSTSTGLASSPLESAVSSPHPVAPSRAFSTLRDLHMLAEVLASQQQQHHHCGPMAHGPAATLLVVTTSDRAMFGPLIDHVIECQPYKADYGMYDDVLDSLATALCGAGGVAAAVAAAGKGSAADVATALRRCGLTPGRLQPSPVMQALRAQLAIKAATAASASSRAGASSGRDGGSRGHSNSSRGSGAAGASHDPRAMARLVEVLAAAAADPLRAVRESQRHALERQQLSGRGPQSRSCKSAGGAAATSRRPPRSGSERRSGSGNEEVLAHEELRLQHIPKPLRSLGGRVSRSTGDLASVSSAPGALTSYPPRSAGSGSCGSPSGTGQLRERRSGGRRSSSPPPQFYLPPIPEQPLLEHLGEPGTASCPASPSRCASGSLALALVAPGPSATVAATAVAAAAALSSRRRAPKCASSAAESHSVSRWAFDVNALPVLDMAAPPPSAAPSPVAPSASAALALPTACSSAPPSDTASVCSPKSGAISMPSPPLSPTSPLSPLALGSPISGSTLGAVAGMAGRSGRSVGSSFTSVLAAAAAAMMPSVGSSGSSSSVHGRTGGGGRNDLESRPKSFPSALKPPAARFATGSSSRVFPGSTTGSASGQSLLGSGSRAMPSSMTGVAAAPPSGASASPGSSISAAASALRVATSRLLSRLLGGTSRKSRPSRGPSTAAASPVATPTASCGGGDVGGSNPFGTPAAGAVVAHATIDVFLPPSPFSSLRVQEDCDPALGAAPAAASSDAACGVGDTGGVVATASAPIPALGVPMLGEACTSPHPRLLDQPLASAPAALSATATPEAAPALPRVVPISRRDAALASEALFVASHIDEVLAAALSEAEGLPPATAASLVATVERTSVFVERSSSGGAGTGSTSNSNRSSACSSPCKGNGAAATAHVSRALSGQEQALLCAQPLFARAAAAARSLEHPRLRGAVQEAVRRYLNPRRGSVRDALVAVVDVAAEGEGLLHATAAAAAADIAAVAMAAAARCRS
ncbi:hypothetical protein HYH02_003612 [Chlamydomonas schloesseri]|uniref:Uncharacterized protein n=1 Tax=Chlamydomonas schloesseri TaxID=2026947 RepID=A0A836B9I9_9CHLO|nr:hypothetical protein HYH02_003612 [Chlamydomonas schloesseri]|eukprot:KAG2451836.1 hypothetical protein HYH02_003612 [Chlamydomonas schloesseri]